MFALGVSACCLPASKLSDQRYDDITEAPLGSETFLYCCFYTSLSLIFCKTLVSVAWCVFLSSSYQESIEFLGYLYSCFSIKFGIFAMISLDSCPSLPFLSSSRTSTCVCPFQEIHNSFWLLSLICNLFSFCSLGCEFPSLQLLSLKSNLPMRTSSDFLNFKYYIFNFVIHLIF